MATFVSPTSISARPGLVLVTSPAAQHHAIALGVLPDRIDNVIAFAALPGCAVLADESAPAGARERCWHSLCVLMRSEFGRLQ